MKIYFKVLIPIFITVLAYTVLTVFLGPKGIYAQHFIEAQRDTLVNHVRSLRQTGDDLDSLIRNLTYDPETIAIYAHELGYIYDNEGIIKLVNFNSGFGKGLNPGTILKIETPYFLSDYICKTIAASLGIIVIIFQMLAVRKDGYFKKDPKSLETAASVLKKGEIIIVPTDTVYGFSGIMPFTKEKIIKIKKRGAEKSFISLIEKPQDIYKYTDTPVPEILLNLWPAPLSIIVRDKEGRGTSAFRCPDDVWLRNLIGLTGFPIYSTSVNYSGEPVLSDIRDIISEFEDKVSLIVDGGEQKGLSSTIVSLTDKEPCIIRQGALKISF